jgi:exportin-2 (importin alpha re-exporter)
MTEFMPYVFQILSQLLESQKTGDLSEDYLQLLPPLINPDLWRTKANTTPLVRLLQAYLRRGATNVVETNKLQGILGVWQNLISSRLYDAYGFDLLMTIFLEVPMSSPTPPPSQTAILSLNCFSSRLRLIVGRVYNSMWEMYSIFC